ncbi:MAG: DNA polymerase III [Treponema sp.]|nr:DNA polymerase III [Treponema sp.]
MFENVLGQSAVGQLIEDIRANTLSRAMLFSGPPVSGKGTAALELGRVISCEAGDIGRWNCACPACARHRILIHPDLLCMGRKNFSAEIAASAGAFLREATSTLLTTLPVKTETSPCRILFIRSVRKLLARFSPVLWEDDPKASKISSLVNSLEEDLDEISSFSGGTKESFNKFVDEIKKDAFKLESEGMSETIPIAQLRRAAWWCRLAPSGNGKLLVIENADRMQEEGRNSLLKLLEEPSARLSVLLTSARPGSLLPTILSRLRPYRFNSRDAAVEADVIKRVFRDKAASEEAASTGLEAYLDSFLPVSAVGLQALASYFAASVAHKAALLAKRGGRALSGELVLLGKYSAARAEAAGLGRPKDDSGPVIAVILEKADKFEVRSLFPRFLSYLLQIVSQSQSTPRQTENEEAVLPDSSLQIPHPSFFEMWMKGCNWAESAVGTYNLRPAPVLEKLFTDLSRGMAEL